jgi:hypothetical protein
LKTEIKNRRKLTVAALILIFVLILVIGLIDANYRPQPIPQSSFELKVRQQHYNGVSSAGTLIQVTDKGFAITGTSTNGNLLLIRTQPNINTELLWQKTYGNGSGNAVILT